VALRKIAGGLTTPDFTWSRWLSLLVVRAEEPAATGPRQERLDRLGNNAV